jgi:hypothetical protein
MEPAPPVVCTLTTKSLARRRLEWADLRAIAFDAKELRRGAIVELPLDRYEDVADLVARELTCCGTWLDIELRRKTDRLVMRIITSNPDGVELIRKMAGLAKAD